MKDAADKTEQARRYGSAAECLRAAHGELIAEWERRVRAELPAAHNKRRFVLVDSLPQFIEAMIASLEARSPQLRAANDVAETHASQRSSFADYDLGQVLAEYHLLRRVIFERLDAEVELTTRERDLVLDVLQSGKDAAAERYVARAEERRRQMEGWYRALFDALGEGFCVVRVQFDGAKPIDYRFVEVNPAFARHTGIEGARGRSMREIAPEHEEHWFDTYGRVASSGEAARFESHARALGRVFDVFAFRIGEPEERLVAILFKDVTTRHRTEEVLRQREAALRESEERFRQLADAMPQIVWTARPDGTVDYFNNRSRELDGIRREGESWSWEPVLHPDHRQATVEAWKRAVESGELYEIAHRIKRADDGYHWYLSRAVPARDAEGRIDRWFGTATDIEAQKEIEEALRSADDRKNGFLAMLAHELRNPLAPVRNSIYVLEHAAPGGEQARRALEIIARQVQQMSRLVDDLLDVSRISRGKIGLRQEIVDVNALACRVLEDHRTIFEDNEVTLECIDARRPLMVQGDPARLAQVFGNLLSNSAKFTPPGGRTTLEIGAAPDAMAVIRVRDDGVGIAPETLARLFTPFEQAEQTLDRGRGGLGLGLALVKNLVEMHGGTVSARSEGLGRGAELTVRLPLREEAHGEAGLRAAAPPRVKRRVLVIEDSVDAAESLRDALEITGHEVALAHSGSDGLETARTFEPDVVLCDIGLPEMDGYEVARAFRADRALRRVFLVALSGYAQAEDLRRASAAGFDRHLAKPASLDALEEIIAAAGGALRQPSVR